MPMCQHCKQDATAPDLIRYEGKNYHIACQEIVVKKYELYRYICQLFHFKTDTMIGNANHRLLRSYLDQGMSYEGILNALKYFYEVKKMTKDKAGERIGIVPYVYEEAQEYYRRQNNTVDKIANQLKEPERLSISLDTTAKKRPKIDLDSI